MPETTPTPGEIWRHREDGWQGVVVPTDTKRVVLPSAVTLQRGGRSELILPLGTFLKHFEREEAGRE